MTTPIDPRDPDETQEWLDALEDVLEEAGPEQVSALMTALVAAAQRHHVALPFVLSSPYCNTIAASQEKKMPIQDDKILYKVQALLRWNAVAMVLRAGKFAPELGGHIASYASAAVLYEVGFDYFFKGPAHAEGADLLYIQGHSSPGIYARAFLEGRLTEAQLTRFRQEASGPGLSSYPHPWLMGSFWQFATVSMGLGPLQAIYQARFLKYLESRSLVKPSSRKIWAFLGDGETDEPETLGGLSVAAREQLDNLIFVVNCNLQRLDGPVRGNGKIIQELESIFKGAGWRVIKVIWGSRWDPLLAADHDGRLQRRMAACVDGEYQSYKARDGAFVREHFFGADPVLKARVAHMSDDEIWHLNRGGHDFQKVYAAYAEAVETTGQPVVVLAKTIKGFGMGVAGEGQNITHQQKKMTEEELKVFCKRFDIPLSEDQIKQVSFYRPKEDSPEIRYMQARRQALGGYLPARYTESLPLEIPKLNAFEPVLAGSGDRAISTTMAFVRLLAVLLRDPVLGKRVVPIVPDESRTFGMEGLFKQIGIYSPVGQLYEPVDSGQLMSYYESKEGQLLEEGINEAGAFCSWMAAATSYSNHQLMMVPFYIYYSMFGFQRVGDFAWAAGDMQARGFLLGATAGRTTLAGEGLQHQDGHSHLLASVIPNCVAYDPAYAYEVAVIIHHGLERMMVQQDNVFFYLTLMNENIVQPPLPKNAEEGIIRGMYCVKKAASKKSAHVQLLGSGMILQEVLEAARLLESDYGVSADVWSVTSFTELRKDLLAVERANRLHAGKSVAKSFVETQLTDETSPVIAATDYVRLHAEQIRSAVRAPYTCLGTDGFGRSDTRKALRDFFEVDATWILLAAIEALVKQEKLTQAVLLEVMKRYAISPNKPDPMRT